jgi:tRNA (cmo5U34)-methyltransferase
MTDHWSEENSELYRQFSAVVVPARAEQVATLLTLLPFAQQEPFRAVELASGEGMLADALLRSFSRASVAALDGSLSMREATARRLAAYGTRAAVHDFNLAASDWYPQLDGADCVLSSLCIHHLTGSEKQELFGEVVSRLSPRGVFLIADLILPQTVAAQNLFAAAWDRSTHEQALEKTGSVDLFDRFVAEQWNYFHFPDPFDKPSPLFEQLMWLKRAGLEVVDCFWLRAGHAIYGGYRRANMPGGIAFGEALHHARIALGEV